MKKIIFILPMALALHGARAEINPNVVCCSDSKGRQCLAHSLAECDSCYDTCSGISGEPVGGCPDECPSTLSWSIWPAKHYYEMCVKSGTLLSYCKYECMEGFYGAAVGSPLMGYSISCTACPAPGFSERGATAVTDCYISGSSSDASGTYEYTSPCYYSE